MNKYCAIDFRPGLSWSMVQSIFSSSKSVKSYFKICVGLKLAKTLALCRVYDRACGVPGQKWTAYKKLLVNLSLSPIYTNIWLNLYFFYIMFFFQLAHVLYLFLKLIGHMSHWSELMHLCFGWTWPKWSINNALSAKKTNSRFVSASIFEN